MKVLIFNSLYYPNIIGGAERSVQILAEGLLEWDIAPVIVTTSDRDFVDYVNNVKVYYINAPNLYWMKTSKEQPKWKKPFWHLFDMYNPFVNKKISIILQEENPDIIHTNNLAGFSVAVWRLAKKFKLPILHTIRDYYLLCPSSTMFSNGRNCGSQCKICKMYSLVKKIFSNTYIDGVIGISKFILNRHLNFGYFKNCKIKTFIYNPIRLLDRLSLRKERNEIVLGLIGVMSTTKGTEFVLRCFKELDLPNVKLLVYGRGINKDYEKKLKAEYASCNIIFKGFEEPEKIYNNLDVTIIPSLWHEPFSRVLIESYSYGVPVLASNRGGIPENVIEGKTGFIFDPDKKEDFKKKLKLTVSYVLGDKFSYKEIIKFSKKFQDSLIIKNYISQYKKLIGANVRV